MFVVVYEHAHALICRYVCVLRFPQSLTLALL